MIHAILKLLPVMIKSLHIVQESHVSKILPGVQVAVEYLLFGRIKAKIQFSICQKHQDMLQRIVRHTFQLIPFSHG